MADPIEFLVPEEMYNQRSTFEDMFAAPDPRTDAPIYNPTGSGDASGQTQLEVPQQGGQLNTGGGSAAGLDVPAPTGPVESPFSQDISDLMVDIETRQELARQGYDMQGRPLQAMPGTRAQFEQSYFEEHGNPFDISLSGETDRLMNENLEQLWNSFFQGTVPFKGRMTAEQSKGWNQFIQGVYADTYNRVQVDKKEQMGRFEYAMGKFSVQEAREYKENQQRDKLRADRVKGILEDEQEFEQFKRKEEFKRKRDAYYDQDKPSVIRGKLWSMALDGQDMSDLQLDIMGLQSDAFKGAHLLGKLISNNPRIGSYISNQAKPENIPGFETMTKPELQAAMTQKFVDVVSSVSKHLTEALDTDMPLSDVKEIKDAEKFEQKMNKTSMMVASELISQIDRNATADEQKHQLVDLLIQSKGYSPEEARDWVEYETQRRKQLRK